MEGANNPEESPDGYQFSPDVPEIELNVGQEVGYTKIFELRQLRDDSQDEISKAEREAAALVFASTVDDTLYRGIEQVAEWGFTEGEKDGVQLSHMLPHGDEFFIWLSRDNAEKRSIEILDSRTRERVDYYTDLEDDGAVKRMQLDRGAIMPPASAGKPVSLEEIQRLDGLIRHSEIETNRA
jgi:hypothetical protein